MSTHTHALEESGLIAAGQTCRHASCNTIDFLPFKCSHCLHLYCQDHWKPEAHQCNKFDAQDRVVPQCPLCNLPVNVPQGQNPNIAMEQHISSACSVVSAKKNKTGHYCANSKCGKALISPIVCQDCKQEFCPTHRFPNSHTCRPQPASTSKTPSQGNQAAAGFAALKRAAASNLAKAETAIAATKAKANAANPESTPAGPSHGKPNIFKELKTDRCEPLSIPRENDLPTTSLPSSLPSSIPKSLRDRPNRRPPGSWAPKPIFSVA